MYTKFLRNYGAFTLAPSCLKGTGEKKMPSQGRTYFHQWNRVTGGSVVAYNNKKVYKGSTLPKQQQQRQQFQVAIASLACGSNVRYAHDWKRQMNINEQRRKTIPKLVYLHNPWKYMMTKMNLWKLKWLWDYDFNENDFIEGSKQAAVVMTNIIRDQSTDKIGDFTTPVGFQQITRDMLLSRNDTRLKLVRFELEHLRRAIPMKVATRQNFGRKYAFIDMLFVGLRNTKDFDSAEEAVEVNDIIRKMDEELKTPPDVLAVPHRIVFAEIFIRFRRDYTDDGRHEDVPLTPPKPPPSVDATPDRLAPVMGKRKDGNAWSVSFYKILTFDVLNYDPNPKR